MISKSNSRTGSIHSKSNSKCDINFNETTLNENKSNINKIEENNNFNVDRRLDEEIDLNDIYTRMIFPVKDISINNLNKKTPQTEQKDLNNEESTSFFRRNSLKSKSSKEISKTFTFSMMLSQFICDFKEKFKDDSIEEVITKTIKLYNEDFKEKIKIFEKYSDNILELEFSSKDRASNLNRELMEELIKESLILEMDNENLDRNTLFNIQLQNLINKLKTKKKNYLSGSSLQKLFDLIHNIFK